MSKRNARRSAAEWEAIVADFHQSGLSVQAFCNHNQLALATFSKWKRRITEKQTIPVSENAPAFVPLVHADKATPQPTSSVNLQIGRSITLSVSVTGATVDEL